MVRLLTAIEFIRKFVISMNFMITCAMGYLFYLFLSQDGVFDGWIWLYYLPIYAAIFLGPSILMCISLFKNSSVILKIVFLILNLFTITVLLGTSFESSWFTSITDLPLSLRSYRKLSLILAVPFIANAMTLCLMFFEKRFFTGRKCCNHLSH